MSSTKLTAGGPSFSVPIDEDDADDPVGPVFVFVGVDKLELDFDDNMRKDVFFLSYQSSLGRAIGATEAVVISYSSS